MPQQVLDLQPELAGLPDVAMPFDLAAHVDSLDWRCIDAALDADGFATIPGLLDVQACAALSALYPCAARFRSRISMQRHGFGRGEYQYFDYPLPSLIAGLRAQVYPQLASIANRWGAALGSNERFPADLSTFLQRCHAGGQMRPTPLLLRYGPGDYNCLHQDLYGANVFPLQLIVLLSRPGCDFRGGELVLTEQRPRMQSRVSVVPLAQGDAAVIAVHQRPVAGARGSHRVNQRHGVSRVLAGQRDTLGVIFHDGV